MNRRQDSTTTAPHTRSRFASFIDDLDVAADAARGRKLVRTQSGDMRDADDYAEFMARSVRTRELEPTRIDADDF